MNKYLKKVQELREEKKGLTAEMKQLNETAEKEERDFNEDEEKRWGELEKETAKLDKQIERNLKLEAEEQAEREAAEEAEKRGEMKPKHGNEEKRKKDLRKFSFVKAIREYRNGNLSGLEKEMHEEGQRNNPQGQGLQIPYIILNQGELRAATATGVSGEVDAGDFVPTELRGFIDNLRERMVLAQMGADFITGLSGNVDFPKKTSDVTATWESEMGEVSASDIGASKVSLTPHRLSALTKISKQLMLQSSPDVERIVRDSLLFATMNKLQQTAINGATGGDNPVGILNNSSITNTVDFGANGAGNPTHEKMVEFETKIAVDNADMGKLAYLSNAKVRGYLKTLAKDSGSGRFVFENNEVNGYPFYVTNHVPSNLTEGTHTTEDLSAMIFGNWEDLIIAQFGGLDIIVDPYTSKTTGLTELQVDSFWDIDLKREESFAIAADLNLG
jgi:HK97 family phage major capsid protein